MNSIQLKTTVVAVLLGLVYFGKSAKVDKERSAAYQKQLFEQWEKDGKI